MSILVYTINVYTFVQYLIPKAKIQQKETTV